MATSPSAARSDRRAGKSPAAFKTISEVAGQLDVPQHVLRFWETRFSQIRPLKRGGGRRYYRPEDIELLDRIKTLLYADGYTIKGVQKLLRESGRSPIAPAVAEAEEAASVDSRQAEIEAIMNELVAVRNLLKNTS